MFPPSPEIIQTFAATGSTRTDDAPTDCCAWVVAHGATSARTADDTAQDDRRRRDFTVLAHRCRATREPVSLLHHLVTILLHPRDPWPQHSDTFLERHDVHVHGQDL